MQRGGLGAFARPMFPLAAASIVVVRSMTGERKKLR
jgi:hypothetical protein